MNTNKDVEEYLDYYLNPCFDTDYAVMINGNWGAGKTYFIKSYLNKKSKANTNNQFKYFYVSLYGIRSTEEIKEQFFSQAIPILDSKYIRLCGSIVSQAINIFAGVELTKEHVQKFQHDFLNIKDCILVFDDLERCSMQLVDVMGYINTFVENDHMKVIVLANENEISSKTDIYDTADEPTTKININEYRKIKEKLIGKTLKVKPEILSVIEVFADEFSNDKVIQSIKNASADIESTIISSGKPNLRSLRGVLQDYDRLVSKVSPALQDVPEAMRQLLLFMLALGLEFRCGNLKFEHISSLSNEWGPKYLLSDGKHKSNPESPVLEEIMSKYTEVSWGNVIIPYKSVADLFQSGIIDQETINNYLKQHPLVVGNTVAPAWRVMWSFFEISATEYQKAKNSVVSDLSEYKFTHAGVILHIAGLAIRSDEYDEQMLGDGVDIVSYFKQYFNQLLTTKRLEADRSVFDSIHTDNFDGLVYTSKDSAKFKAIYEIAKDATYKSFDDKMQEIANVFIDKIRSNPDLYASLYNREKQNWSFGNAAFLHHIDEKLLAQFIISDCKLNGDFMDCLEKRYENDSYNHSLKEEYLWVKRLQGALNDISSSATPPFKEFLKRQIEHYFNKINDSICRYQNSQSS